MYLKALEIQGFKSFPEKTVLNFGEEVTAIVGPNGSGKSNVSDAIRWVMGETSYKSLRGSKMEDVIFGGTEKRSQMSFAQVKLVLDNTAHIFPQMEEDEVSVTRRYFRSGESEYYINKQSVRLTDVNLLFMDTGMGRDGYSIIGQGRIDEILSQKSADRREIFEEAAGIAKFRHSKEKAEADLKRTEDNLTLVNAMIAELEPQENHLREQAEKAKRYLVLSGEQRVLEISVWLDQLDKIRTDGIRLDTDLSLAEQELDRVNAERAELYAENEKFSERIAANDMEQDRVRGEDRELTARQSELDAAVAKLNADISHNEENIRRMEADLQDRSGRAEDLSGQIGEKEKRIAELDASEKELLTGLEKLKARAEELSRGAGEAGSEADQLSAREALAVSAAAESRADASAARSGISENEQRRRELSAECETVGQQVDQLRAEAKENRRALVEAEEDAAAIRNIIKGHSMKMEGRTQREAQAREAQGRLERELNSLDDRIRLLSELEREYEGFGKAVKTVMQAAERKQLRGVHGPVASLMSTDNRCAVAIEIALGAKLQDIVVDREEDAKAAINLLKQSESGRATFQPLTAIRGAELHEQGLENEYGFVGVASSLVKFDEKYRAVFHSILGNTVVVENLDCGIAIARKYQHRFRIVTLDGQVINRGGSMTGGSLNRSVGILSRANELKELSARRGGLAERLAAAVKSAAEAKRELEEANYTLETAKGQQREAEDRVLKLSGDKSHYDVMLDAGRKRLEEIEADLEKIDGHIAELKKAIAEKETIAEKRDAEAAALRREAEQKRSGQSELLRDSSALRDEITEKSSDLSGCRAERDATREALRGLQIMREQMQGDESAGRARIEEYRAACEAARKEIEQNRAGAGKLEKEREALRGELEKLNAAKLGIEQERTKSMQRMKDLDEHVTRASGAVSGLRQRRQACDMEAEQYKAKLWDNYELSVSAAEEQRVEVESTAKANRRIGELKREIAQLGSVNPNAVEEFERIDERYTLLTTQRDDVEKAKDSLEGVIADVTRKMTDVFREQFDLIRKSFEETFLDLFGGGRATLELEDEDDVLNCGIEIKVQPPGKALKTITLLSGGEKAFVAIALYFAILKVHPTPFCVMDEIEAALDTANVSRVAHYMRNLSDKTQFIVITHRPETMETVDVLYGVTMQERGVSKVLKIKMDDMVKELGIKEQT